MKRGIFRIIAGSILILVQIIATISLSSSYYYYDAYNPLHDFSFYTDGIVGIVLLIFGVSAYNKGLRSQLVLHTRSRKLHTVIKWVAFVITALLLVYYLISFRNNDFYLIVYTSLMIIATLSFVIYLLFYLYKKPSCLFSTCLIFIGIAYIFGVIGNLTFNNYMLYRPYTEYYKLMVIFSLITKLIAGILYIVLASKLYKENFSVKAIKVIGWITFAMEFSNLVLYQIIVGDSYYFHSPENLLYILFVICLLLYISVFKINTLREQATDETRDVVRFCRKCGNKLPDGAMFCNKCGTAVIKEA